MTGYTFLNFVLALLVSVSLCTAQSDESQEVPLEPNPATILYTAKPSPKPTKPSVSNDESSTTESSEELISDSTTPEIEVSITESTGPSTPAAPRVCSPIQVLYQKIQDELEKIVAEISKFQQEAMSKITDEQHLLLQQSSDPAPSPPPAAAIPARMNLIQLWNMVQLLQQNQQLSASQQLLQQAATISPPVTQGTTSR